MKKLIIIILSLFLCGQAFGETIKIGVFADLHYDNVLYPENLEYIDKAISIFSSEGVDVIIGLGDQYGGPNSDEQHEAQILILESRFKNSTNTPVYFVVGNHEYADSTTIEEYLSWATLTPSKNFTVDIGDDYRIIAFCNSENYYFRSSATTLTWLESSLEEARVAGKKIVIATHLPYYQDYPGNPANWASEPNKSGTATPSATTGSGITITNSENSYEIGYVGLRVHIKQGADWGYATITGYTDEKNVTADVVVDFANTNASDKWGFDSYSNFSMTSSSERGLIETAISNGASVLCGINGHWHSNATETVNSIPYYIFDNMGQADDATVSILEIADDSIFIAGCGRNDSYGWTKYYISTGGNDSYTGRLLSHPFQTLGAIPSLSAGESVYLSRGQTWVENLTLSDSGTNGNEINLLPTGSGTSPTIQGILTISGDYIKTSGIRNIQ